MARVVAARFISRPHSGFSSVSIRPGCEPRLRAKDYEVSERTGADGKTEYLIRHKAFEKVTALTIALDPAYEQTSVKAREIYNAEHQTEAEEAAKREAEARAAEEAENMKQREMAAQRRRSQRRHMTENNFNY